MLTKLQTGDCVRDMLLSGREKPRQGRWLIFLTVVSQEAVGSGGSFKE